MKNYGSDLYFVLAILAGFATGVLFFYIYESFIVAGIAGFSFSLVYNWFSKVLYGLEENGNILQEISKKLEKNLAEDIEDDEIANHDIDYLSDEESIEDYKEEEMDVLIQDENINEKIDIYTEHWIEKKEINKAGLYFAILLPIVFVIYIFLNVL